MRRVACVRVPALPLQLLARQRPGWAGHPRAVVEADRPQARVQWVDARARRQGVRPGMRLAAARSLARGLLAEPVDDETVSAAASDLVARLRRHGPRIFRFEEGASPRSPRAPSSLPHLVWLDASGLERLHDTLSSWAASVHDTVRRAGLEAAVVVGFRHFSTLAIASCVRGVRVLDDPEEERRLVEDVPLARLALAPRTLGALERLGVRTLAGLLELPEHGLRARFGAPDDTSPLAASPARLRRLAAGDEDLRPARIPEDPPIRARIAFEPPVSDHTVLLFRAKGLLPRLRRRLEGRGEAFRALRLALRLERADALPGSSRGRSPLEVEETIRPAEPTRDEGLLADLLRLRLEALELPAAAEELALEAEGVRIDGEQPGLLDLPPRRDPEAALRALARVRAELGDEGSEETGALVRAVLRDAHLPEAQFRWVPLAEDDPPPLSAPRVEAARPLRLVRRLLVPAEPWRAAEAKAATPRDGGPDLLSGGWWHREVRRRYRLEETPDGRLLWVFYDGRRGRWFLHAIVE